MRLQVSKSPNAASYYVVESIRKDGVSTSRIVEKLGTLKNLTERFGESDPEGEARVYVKELTREKEEGRKTVIKKYRTNEQVEKDKQIKYNGGYLFLQKIYHELGLHKICKEVTKRHKFRYDLDGVLSRLLYSRMLYPSSKLKSYELSKNFIEQPTFKLEHIYRGLDVLCEEMEFIQSEVYKNSKKTYGRNNQILYYDCTNYFFEIEEADGLKQYGKSKEHRPTPLVQMGFFMDGDEIPLAFNITPGNQNEQVTLKPLEKQIMKDFEMSKFVVCTDAGLASSANRKFNDKHDRSFITTQSVKKLKKTLKDWALEPTGWKLEGTDDTFDISELVNPEIPDDDPKAQKRIQKMFDAYMDKTFYKERWINEDGLSQKLIITFSLKYKMYQIRIRNNQIERAKKLMSTPSKLKKKGQTDVKRFIKTTTVTTDGEVAEKKRYSLDMDVIAEEMKFDGFYGVCTNLDDDASLIIDTNHKRWKIEECFRIMKTEFEARPIYLSRENRIKAHFLTCFLALLIYKYLEKKLKADEEIYMEDEDDDLFTCSKILDQLRNMEFLDLGNDEYFPLYTRNDFTDALHDIFGFRTDYECTEMKNIFKLTKS